MAREIAKNETTQKVAKLPESIASEEIRKIVEDLYRDESPKVRFKLDKNESVSDRILREKDPEVIMTLATLNEEGKVFPGIYVSGESHKKNMALVVNDNTPSILLFRLYHEPAPERAVQSGPHEMIEGAYPSAESVEDNAKEAREASKKALIARDWMLTEWERKENTQISLEEKEFYARLRRDDKAYAKLTGKMNEKTLINKASSEVIGFVRKEGRRAGDETFDADRIV